MAQPLVKNAPAIRIASWCSSNRFTAQDVHHRARTIEKELNEAGIQMVTYSADGDSRELKMMRESIRLGLEAPKRKRRMHIVV